MGAHAHGRRFGGAGIVLKLDMHHIGRRTRPFLIRGALAAILAGGSFSGTILGATAKTRTGSGDAAPSSVVVAHSGNGVRMRTAAGGDVLDIFPDGTAVELRSGVDGTVVDSSGVRWWPVVVYGENGWIAGDFLDDGSGSNDSSSSADSSDSTDSSSGAFTKDDRVQVRTDDGGGLAMRDEPSTSGKRIAALGDGDIVTVVSGPVTDSDGGAWYKINDGDTDAYVSASFLVAASGDAAASTTLASSSGFAEGDRVAVASDDGTGLVMRDEPSTSGKRLGALGDGDVVTVVSGPVSDDDGGAWYKINDGDTDAYVAATYLVAATDAPSSSSSASSSSAFASGDTVAVASDDGTGLAMREEPSTSGKRIGALGDGDVVTIVSGPVTDSDGGSWYKINDGDTDAYVSAAYLVASSSASATKPSASSSNESASFAAGDFVTAVSGSGGVNLRGKTGTSGTVRGTLTESEVGTVEDGPTYDTAGNAWYQVTVGNITGYAREDFLAATSGPATEASEAAKAAAPTYQFIYPIASFTLTQPYGCTGLSLEPWNATLGCYFHNGVDLAANAYTPIMATAAGVVTAAGWCDCGLGFYVTIDHGNGFSSTYGHMAEQPWVSVGQTVAQGDVIGPVGSTGASTGPHTHFMILLNGQTVDPLQYLPAS